MKRPHLQLGPITTWNRRLHAIRILPFVRANGIAVVLLGMLAAIAAGEAWDALRSGAQPAPTSLARVLGPSRVANPFVEVTGMVFPRKHWTYPASRARLPQFVYIPMLDEPSRRILLVRFAGELGVGEPREVTIAGMLQAPDPQVVRQLDAEDWQLAGVPVDRRHVLVAGMTPKPLWLFASVALLAAGLALAFLAAMLFPPAPAEEAKSP